jgi:hypothetical protein
MCGGKHFHGGNKDMTAKLLAVIVAAGLLIGSSVLGYAQGSKESAPGQRMQNEETAPVPGRPGASGYSPGQQMQEQGGPKSGQEPGASGYAPGRQPGTSGQGGGKDTPNSR